MLPLFLAPFGWFWGFIGILIVIAIIGCIIRAIVFAAHGGSWHSYRHWRRHHRWEDWTESDDTAAQAKKILDERYAKGEIDDEEYKRKKENLK